MYLIIVIVLNLKIYLTLLSLCLQPFFFVPLFENQVVHKRSSVFFFFRRSFESTYISPWEREFRGRARAFFSDNGRWSSLSARLLTYHVRYGEGSSKHKEAVDVLDEGQFAIGQDHEGDKKISQIDFERPQAGEDTLSSSRRGLTGFFNFKSDFVFVGALFLFLPKKKEIIKPIKFKVWVYPKIDNFHFLRSYCALSFIKYYENKIDSKQSSKQKTVLYIV